jgi:hypothetical protein
MTIFGPDISSYQKGLDLAKLSAASFVIAKTTEGTYYTDSGYQGWRQQAAALGKPFIWYHFLSGEDAHAQVAHTTTNVRNMTLPGMLDVEPNGAFHPTLAQVLAYVDAAHDVGLNLRLVYLPRWFWEQLGEPDLSPLAARGLGLISSAYPGGEGTPQHLYPGDSAKGWQSYGGLTPLLYQFTNQATDAGVPLDYNAFRGSLSQLLAYLHVPAPSPAPPTPSNPSGGPTMGTIPPSISQKWPELAGDFPPNATFTDEAALIWADGGARAAALFAKQARDAVTALAAKVATLAVPSIDVTALAAALGPLLHAGASADEVATAVVDHLAASLQKG